MSEQEVPTEWITAGADDKDKRRTYMREWKRKKYAENPDSIKSFNKTAYYKSKYNGRKEDIQKYGEMFPVISKITSSLEELRELNVEMFRDIIRKYSFEVSANAPI